MQQINEFIWKERVGVLMTAWSLHQTEHWHAKFTMYAFLKLFRVMTREWWRLILDVSAYIRFGVEIFYMWTKYFFFFFVGDSNFLGLGENSNLFKNLLQIVIQLFSLRWRFTALYLKLFRMEDSVALSFQLLFVFLAVYLYR